MPSKKNKPKEKVETKNGWLINNLEDLKIAFDEHKPTPIERVMAMRLLMNDVAAFWYQKKLELPGESIVNGRKYFVADFVFERRKIIIEVDGKIHETPENQTRDRYKDMFLLNLGYVTFRFSWDDVMESNEEFDVLELVGGFAMSQDDSISLAKAEETRRIFELSAKEFSKEKEALKNIKLEIF